MCVGTYWCMQTNQDEIAPFGIGITSITGFWQAEDARCFHRQSSRQGRSRSGKPVAI